MEAAKPLPTRIARADKCAKTTEKRTRETKTNHQKTREAVEKAEEDDAEANTAGAHAKKELRLLRAKREEAETGTKTSPIVSMLRIMYFAC